MRCIVPSCNHDSSRISSKGITFHRFPKEPSLYLAWLQALNGQDWVMNESSAVCSNHFREDDLSITSPGLREVRVGAVPIRPAQIKLEGVECSADVSSDLHRSNLGSRIQQIDPYNVKVEFVREESTDGQTDLKDTPCMYKGTAIKSIKKENCDFPDQDNINKDATKLGVVYLPSINQDTLINNKPEIHDMTDHDSLNKNQSLTKHKYPVEYSIKVEKNDTSDEESLNAGTNSSDREYVPDSVEVPSVKSGEKLFTCEICQKKFKQISSLQRHSKTHSGERPYSCEVCSKTFTEKGSLSMHLRIHSGERPYTCEICNKKFNQKINLRTHLKIHSGEKPYSCEVCNKAFRLKYVLIKHMRIHSSEKPYLCEICNKGFKQRSSLLKHLRTHSGEKPYACEICEKAFSEKDSLQMHWKTHTGEKPFPCDICQKTFRKNYILQIHKRIHSGEKPFSCEICEKTFRHKNVLQEHLSVHSGEKPFSCPVCEKTFRLRSYLHRHMSSHTKKILDPC